MTCWFRGWAGARSVLAVVACWFEGWVGVIVEC